MTIFTPYAVATNDLRQSKHDVERPVTLLKLCVKLGVDQAERMEEDTGGAEDLNVEIPRALSWAARELDNLQETRNPAMNIEVDARGVE